MPRFLDDLGAAFLDRGDLQRAEALFNRSIELAQDEHNQAGLALAYNSLGKLALKRREPDAAIDAFRKSLDAMPGNGQLLRTAQVYNNLGSAYQDLPDWTRSEEYLRKSLEITVKAGDTLGQANALNNLADVQAVRGDLKAAIDNYTRAMALFTEMRDHNKAAVVKHNRGKLLRRMDEHDSARTDFTEAMESIWAHGNTIDADAAAQDLQALDDGGGLPWWAWVAIVLFILCVLILIIALAVH